MSSQPESALLRLAPELISHIITHLTSKSDLAKLRLTCKLISQQAAESLFNTIFLSPLDEHINPWAAILNSPTLHHLPHHATIHTQSDISELRWYGGDREEEKLSPGFYHAIAQLKHLPNLTSVTIGFTPECVGDRPNDWREYVVEDSMRRVELLQRIFQALYERQGDENNKPVRTLTITNLQNMPIPSFTSTDAFSRVMSHLSGLHICMTQEHNPHGPDHDYTFVELRTFPPHLCSAWLSPICSTLSSLSLSHDIENWGPLPGSFSSELAKLSFSRLRTLKLGYWTLAHDADLEWILDMASLRELVLENCMIASWIRVERWNMEEWAVDTRDWVMFGAEDEWTEGFRYEGTWGRCFERIEAALPELVCFRFDGGESSEKDDNGLEYSSGCGARLFPQRYVCFDNGILPTHWPEAEEDGELHSWLDDGWPNNVHEENLEADQKSLDGLQESIRSRRLRR